METRAVKDGNGWRINGEKMWNTGVHVASHDMVFCRTSGKDGEARGLTCIIVPMDDPGVKIEEYMWTFNMPTDHARVSFKDVWVPDGAVFGPVDNGLVLARHFVHENRIRQAASGVGAAQYCINESIDYANTRKPFGKPLSRNQAIQWPLVELQTEAEMIRWLIYRTAWEMDRLTGPEIQLYLSDKVSMCNYRGNNLVCNAADWRCRCMAAGAIRATSRSSTFIATTVATASPKAATRSRFATSRATCSASSERTEDRIERGYGLVKVRFRAAFLLSPACGDASKSRHRSNLSFATSRRSDCSTPS